ncbi:M15 family metallopeptidase [Leeuwenhoekiella sp. A16]|uniref:M15 family metallopeptidase n=1 Tax=unclassified Leeuwenhoekiella TaxID=2615029 RepID=UPI003A7FAE9E
MKRRTFITTTAIATTAATLLPGLSFSQNMISEAELIGKGNPDLIEKEGYRLRPEAAKAFDKMKAAAAKENIDIQVVSSYRDYNHQNRIWERKYRAYTNKGLSPEDAIAKIIEYSTIPGTSRHHWGTDLDIIDANGKTSGDVLVPSKFHGNGPFCKLKEWLDKHANEFDFYLVYTDLPLRQGFNYEPWHFSYKPLSQNYLEQYKKLDIKEVLQEQQLLGSKAFTPEFITLYRQNNVLDINPDLLS